MTRNDRQFLTARWTELLLLNFPVPSHAVANLAPPGTEPDLFEGQAYISIVGFQFRDTRVRGCAVPRHTHFPEVNLRSYVRRVVGGEVRRGVVFVQEIVPHRLIALIANRLFHEHYVCRPMRVMPPTSAPTLKPANLIRYAWQFDGRWSSLEARVARPFELPLPKSLDEFIVEHYWGYTQGRDGVTREYRVVHEPWRVAPATEVAWSCDVAANYNSPLGQYLSRPPTSALVADGGAVAVFPGRTL
jgi:uncharacterized protein